MHGVDLNHLLEAFDARPDLVDAVLGQDAEIMMARLAAPPPESFLSVGELRGRARMVVEVRASEDREEVEGWRKMLEANGIDAVLRAQEGEAGPRFTLSVRRQDVELARAGLDGAEDEAPEFCFHCGAGIEAGAATCPECGGDLSGD